MGLTYLGPLQLTAHYSPRFAWTGDAGGSVADRTVDISGSLEWDDAKTLQELVLNPHRRVPLGQVVGVLEPVWNSDELLREFNGWYLFTSVAIDADHGDSLPGGVVDFRLSAVHVAERRIVVTRSARIRPDSITITAKSTLSQVLWNDVNPGDAFEVNPGGTAFDREYDPRTGWETTATTGRNLRLHEGTPT